MNFALIDLFNSPYHDQNLINLLRHLIYFFYIFPWVCMPFFCTVVIKHLLYNDKTRVYVKPRHRSSTSSRGIVKSFSKKSCARFIEFARLNSDKFRSFLTLTTKTKLEKIIFQKLIQNLLKELKKYNISVLYVVELQKRGARHVHCLLTSTIDWKIPAKIWSDAQYRYTNENIFKTCSNIQPFHEKHIQYLSKYLTNINKSSQNIDESSQNIDKSSQNIDMCQNFDGRRWGYSNKGMWKLPQALIYESEQKCFQSIEAGLVLNDIQHFKTDFGDCFVYKCPEYTENIKNAYKFNYLGTRRV
jgi:hypothetical protein